MNSDKNKSDKERPVKKSSGTVETPSPPQHMDPSKKPVKENVGNKNRGRKINKG